MSPDLKNTLSGIAIAWTVVLIVLGWVCALATWPGVTLIITFALLTTFIGAILGSSD